MSDSATLEINPNKTVVYHLVAGPLRFLSFVLYRPRVTGRENIPLVGPVLIAPIHRSNVDFVFTLFVSPRKVFFVAKDGIFKFAPFRVLLLHLGAFPVRRGSADRESMALAEEVLRRGHVLVLFPEGTRKEGRTVEELRDGAMFVAARTGATVVPVGVGGSEKAMPPGKWLPRPARIRIVIGMPIAPPSNEGRVSRSAITAKSEELRAELERVYQQALEELD